MPTDIQIWVVLFGLALILWGFSELFGFHFELWAFIAILFGMAIVIGALRKRSSAQIWKKMCARAETMQMVQ